MERGNKVIRKKIVCLYRSEAEGKQWLPNMCVGGGDLLNPYPKPQKIELLINGSSRNYA